ncbi:MAG TPA: UbiD family decarboxylase [Streptosporangiaceae bacterium]|nr:UbiD family decarboxylase [Streptosporangiaceae bacterium]
MTTWPRTQDLRSWLALLESRGELGVVQSPISADHDVAAVLEHCDARRAVHFRNVRNAAFTLAGNLIHHREHLALALGCSGHQTAGRFAAALRRPRPWAELPAANAPVLANRLDGAELLSLLPLTLQHDRDAGRYFTSALLVVRDPASGQVNLSINRLQAAGEREVRALVLPGRLRRVLEESEQAGHDLDVAIVVGADPLLTLASQSPADRELDDLQVASALRATPLPVVEAPLTGIPVPAGAEFLLEGRFRRGQRAPEGPFGEFPRTYGPAGPAPVIDINAAYHRDQAIFQTILSGGREHFLIGGIPREARLLTALRRVNPDVAAVRLTEGGSCRFHAVVSLRNPRPGDAVAVMTAALAAITTVKLAVVVDDDVDIFDDEHVAWAVATRVQADRDLLIVPRTRGSSLDPSAEGGLSAKAGIDATIPAGERERYARMTVTPSSQDALQSYLSEADGL